jgi:dienelactone hydrolase
MADENKSTQKKSFKSLLGKIFSSTKNGLLDVILKSWKGASIGALIGILFYLITIDTYINTGLGWYVDIPIALSQIALFVLGLGSLIKLLFNTIKKFDARFVTVFVLALIIINVLPFSFYSKAAITFFVICSALIGFAVNRGIRKPVSIIIVVMVLAAVVYSVIGLVDQGTDLTAKVTDQYWNQEKNVEQTDDPSLDGQYKVKSLTYGSGNDCRRAEYGANVTLKAKPVDATPFFDQSSGFFNWMRKLYWKFNSKNYPLNARVWYPDVAGTFPLVLIVHGNHNMTEYSDPGYEYLGKFLASRGYIFASIDENFLNGSWIQDYEQGEVFARGWLLLKHLEQWRKWNDTDGSPFTKKVDLNNVVLIGHSRGGAAVAVASVINKLKNYYGDAKQKFDFNFGIKGIVQIAPNDPYNPQNEIPLRLENINYLILQGGYDQDVSWFWGNRVYNRLKFTDGNYHFKSALYIYHANHGQFNTSWGRKDSGHPVSWFLNLKPIMEPEAQRKIAKIYISAFLDATLKGKNEDIALLRDYNAAKKFLPKDYYINQFEDTNFKSVADYEEDLDVTTASIKGCTVQGKNLKVWNENALYFRDDGGSSQQNLGVYLAWDKKDTTYKNKTAEYSVLMCDSARTILKPELKKNLYFFICNNKDDVEKVNFSIKLIAGKDSSVIALNDKFILPPPLKTKLTKWPSLYSLNKNKQVEKVLQLVEIPIADFVRANKNVKPESVSEIKFVFDKTDSGEIFIDKIGFN